MKDYRYFDNSLRLLDHRPGWIVAGYLAALWCTSHEQHQVRAFGAGVATPHRTIH